MSEESLGWGMGLSMVHDQSHFSSCYSLLASWLLFRYALGGDDGSQMVPSIEIFDPCRRTWMLGEPMKYSRGYSTAAVLKESIYVIGGVQSDDEIVDMVHKIIYFIVFQCVASITYVVLLINTPFYDCRLNAIRMIKDGKQPI